MHDPHALAIFHRELISKLEGHVSRCYTFFERGSIYKAKMMFFPCSYCYIHRGINWNSADSYDLDLSVVPWQIPVRNMKEHSREICYPSPTLLRTSSLPPQTPPSLPLLLPNRKINFLSSLFLSRTLRITHCLSCTISAPTSTEKLTKNKWEGGL